MLHSVFNLKQGRCHIVMLCSRHWQWLDVLTDSDSIVRREGVVVECTDGRNCVSSCVAASMAALCCVQREVVCWKECRLVVR